MTEYISIRGARENNLKNIDLDIPKGKVVVLTGVSGSGKSTLAFGIIFSESQRRYLDSLSPYARRFLDSYDKPDVDFIDGLSPSVAITQRSIAKNPRSTVATITEIYDYMRVMYSRIGVPHSLVNGMPIVKMNIYQMTAEVMKIPQGSLVYIMIKYNPGFSLKSLKKFNITKLKIDGEFNILSASLGVQDLVRENIFLVIEQALTLESNSVAIGQTISSAINLGAKEVYVEIISIASDYKEMEYHNGQIICIAQESSYNQGDVSSEDLHPRLFSFNGPYGACSECGGLGKKEMVDPDLIILNPVLSIEDGVIIPIGSIDNNNFAGMHQAMRKCKKILRQVVEFYGFSCSDPWYKLPRKAKELIFYGSQEEITIPITDEEGNVFPGSVKFAGIVNILNKIISDGAVLSEYMNTMDCPVCKGQRLNKKALSVLVAGKSVGDVSMMSVDNAKDWFLGLETELSGSNLQIAQKIITEIVSRLSFLQNVGLGYICLFRESSTLSGGEGQRIRLASQVGSGLTGITYILDEPSIGLHQSDNDRLVSTVKRLQSLGNTVIVVEHDEDTILQADYVIDIGPGAGANGGQVIVTGSPSKIKDCNSSITGRYLSGRSVIPVPEKRRVTNKYINIMRASVNNLKEVDVNFPIGCFTCVTGVSGGGKSSLVMNVLYNRAQSSMKRPEYERTGGFEYIDKVLNIDQTPIGRTPASNPATYVGLFTHIRNFYASLPEAKAKGYGINRFSFNSRGGRCEVCNGDGALKVEMYFLPDVYVKCEKCNGSRYCNETLQIRYKDKSIADVLSMSVDEAYDFFYGLTFISEKLSSLKDVGLGYIKLGQSATTLSGGEAQRIKLSKELSKCCTGKTLYILDEPTTGLHLMDIDVLLKMLHKLVDKGNTLVVIEHNLHVIKTADYVLDLGPRGGEAGGYIISHGTPEKVAADKNSITGPYLQSILSACSN